MYSLAVVGVVSDCSVDDILVGIVLSVGCINSGIVILSIIKAGVASVSLIPSFSISNVWIR